MSTASIFNFIRISDRIGTAGQPTARQLEAARDEGYEAIINLAPANAENHALPDEAAVVASLGLAYHYIPVEWTNPTPEDFAAFTDAMDQLRAKRVLVHCAANYRVTAFYSLYAMQKDGWTVGQAEELMRRIWESRPEYRMDSRWRSFIEGIRAQFVTAPSR